jgi:molybdopterin-guanine dinucleotide biosynthesis protein A
MEQSLPTLAVLAGGEGSRMGGPKGSLLVRGKPILEYLLDRFAWGGETMLVTAPGIARPSGAERFGRELTDPIAGLGPLRGVLTALETASAEIVIVATVDMPGIGPEQLDWIARELAARPEVRGVMSRRAGGVEPFPSAYRKSAVPVIADHLAQNRRAMQGLLKAEGFVAVESPNWPDRTWINLNTPDDLNLL